MQHWLLLVVSIRHAQQHQVTQGNQAAIVARMCEVQVNTNRHATVHKALHAAPGARRPSKLQQMAG